jgi:hypothetical protein
MKYFAVPERAFTIGLLTLLLLILTFTLLNLIPVEISAYPTVASKVQNVEGGSEPNGSGGILRVTQNGGVVEAILGNNHPLKMYDGYGLRNSFGIDFDPITSKLWDTENGPNYGDEINLVEPGFNGGWTKVQYVWLLKGGNMGKEIDSNLAIGRF